MAAAGRRFAENLDRVLVLVGGSFPLVDILNFHASFYRKDRGPRKAKGLGTFRPAHLHWAMRMDLEIVEVAKDVMAPVVTRRDSDRLDWAEHG